MIDAQIIAACLDSRKAYDKVHRYIEKDDLSPQGQTFWDYVKDWYAKDPAATAVERGQFRERAARNLPERHADTLLGWYDGLPESVSPENVAFDVLEVKRHSAGNLLCAAIQNRDAKKIEPLLSQYSTLLAQTELGGSDIRWTEDDEEMHARLDRQNLMALHPRSLNAKCDGGAARGDHIIVFGRPEAGKTLFTVNLVGGFLRDGRKVLYIGNEEDTYKTRARIISNLSGATKHQQEAEPERAVEVAREKGLDNLRICHMTPGTIAEIDDLLEEIKPDVLVLDQIRNIEYKSDGMTAKLADLAMAVRNLVGKHDCLGVSITQAGDKTERHGQEVPAWLSMSDIDHSRTGLPAQADLIIGIGATNDMVAANQRAISLCKNKLNDDPDGKIGFIVSVDQSRSRVV